MFEHIDQVHANPHQLPRDLVACNPLSKVPTLVTEDGIVLCDSMSICLYLDAIGEGPALLPAGGKLRWIVLRRHALAHGVLDAAVLRRVEGWRAQEPDRLDSISRQVAVCRRTLDLFEAEAASLGDGFTLDLLTLACALGFLDFRFPADHWREGRPLLAGWFDRIVSRPSMQQTMPYD